MFSSQLKYFLYGTVLSASLITLSVSAGTADGVFGEYFKNIINTPCTYGYEVITGFSSSSANYGTRKCTNIATVLGNIPTAVNVGIGTATPNSKLDVRGGIRSQGGLPTGRDLSNVGYAFDTDGDTGLFSTLGTNRSISTGLNAYINNVSALSILANGSNPRVGIGTSTPTEKLEVAGNIKTTGHNIINNTSPTVYMQDTNGLSSMLHTNNNNLYLLASNTNNSLSWATLPSGRWPMQMDLTNGNTRFGGSIDTIGTIKGGDISKDYLPDSRNLNYTLQLNSQNTSSIGFNDSNNNVGSIRFKNNLFTIGANDGWGVANTSFAGNVGIGTTTPTSKLQVNGEITASNLGAGGQFRAVYGNYGSFIRNDGSDTYLLLTNSGSQYGGWNSLRPIRINNATGDVSLSQSLYSLANGNVGIGTNTPGVKLDVSGTSRSMESVISGGAIEGGQMVLGYTATTPTGQSNSTWNIDVDAYNSFRVFRQNSSGAVTVPLYIQETTGNIGIGTSTPIAKLEVAGLIKSTNNGSAYLQGGDDVTLNDVNIANTLGVIGIQDSTKGTLQLGNNAASYIAGSAGNIGIGTSTPTTKLEVAGKITADEFCIKGTNECVKTFQQTLSNTQYFNFTNDNIYRGPSAAKNLFYDANNDTKNILPQGPIYIRVDTATLNAVGIDPNSNGKMSNWFSIANSYMHPASPYPRAVFVDQGDNLSLISDYTSTGAVAGNTNVYYCYVKRISDGYVDVIHKCDGTVAGWTVQNVARADPSKNHSGIVSIQYKLISGYNRECDANNWSSIIDIRSWGDPRTTNIHSSKYQSPPNAYVPDYCGFGNIHSQIVGRFVLTAYNGIPPGSLEKFITDSPRLIKLKAIGISLLK